MEGGDAAMEQGEGREDGGEERRERQTDGQVKYEEEFWTGKEASLNFWTNLVAGWMSQAVWVAAAMPIRAEEAPSWTLPNLSTVKHFKPFS